VGLETSDHTATPFAGRVGDRFIVCDAPVGTDPGIIEILGALARDASSAQEEGNG
jgi:hypothetical protein